MSFPYSPIPIAEAAIRYPSLVSKSEEGLFFYLPKGVQQVEPLRVAGCPKLLLFLGSGSSLILESKEGFDCVIHLEEGAALYRYVSSKEALHWTTNAYLKRGARFESTSLIEPRDQGQSAEDIYVELLQEGSTALLYGGWELQGTALHNSFVNVHHKAGSTHSQQLFKGVLRDHSRSHFKGKIEIGKGAPLAEGIQRNHQLLFDSSQAISEPGIEVYTDDVKASHGATLSRPSSTELFYMQSRGFSKEQGENLLAEAFLAPIRQRWTVRSCV